MTMDNFLSFLQQILTMTDTESASSVALAKAAVTAVAGLAKSSKKTNGITLRAMMNAEMYFDALLVHKDDYAGVPGEYQQNQIKRQRLEHMLNPHC